MKIAVIGSGVSGLVAALRMAEQHDVTLFEADARLGGHANTVDAPDGDQRVAVDTGFLVCNQNTYPNFLSLMQELGVPLAESDMSFSVRSDRRDFEYSGRDLGALYVQQRHLFSLRFHRMVWDILRFYREGRELLTSQADLPLYAWLEQRGFSPQFLEDHLNPMIRAVWSADKHAAHAFPARFLVQFFHNHGFLTADAQPPWLTISGGSRTYVDAIARRFNGKILLNARVSGITRRHGVHGHDVFVETPVGSERFDHAIIACHADQALGMLKDPSRLEQELLSAFPYQPNEAVLHSDARMMPTSRRAWASWNVHLDDEGTPGACVTYWLNSLQPLPTKTDFFVTLNRSHAIDSEKVIQRFDYSHPVFTVDGIALQSRHSELINHRSTSYCGAYWRNGFHEDGVVSAMRVVAQLQGNVLTRAA